MAACAPAGKHSLTHNYGACKAHVSLQYVRTILTLKLTDRWRVKKSVIPGRRLTGQNGTLKAPLPLPLSYPFSLSFSMIWCMAPINVPLLSLNRKTMQKWKHLLKGMRAWCMTSLYSKTAVPPMISRGFQKSHPEDRCRKRHLRVWTKRENQKRPWWYGRKWGVS